MDAADLAAARTAYHDNADYEQTADATKAAAFITACRRLLNLLPARATRGGREGAEVEHELAIIRQELVDARRWLATCSAAATAGRVTSLSFENFREG